MRQPAATPPVGRPSRRFAFFAAVIVLGFAASAALSWGRRSAATAGSRTVSGSIESGGLTRTYLLHVPAQHDAGSPLPLVFVLHGGTQSPESAERMSGMSNKADSERFLAVYPRGTGKLPTWNSGNCCARAMQNHVDDVGFLKALIEKLERDYAVDSRRVYATGISNGAMMSYRLVCELADQFAAVAPVEGALNVDCRPSAPVSVLIFHGTADRLVPYEGGSTPFQISGRRNDTSVADAVAFWVKTDGCSASAKQEKLAEASVDTYSGCARGTAVQLYTIEGGHHMWPGTTISGNHVPATDLIWEFFAAHPKS